MCCRRRDRYNQARAPTGAGASNRLQDNEVNSVPQQEISNKLGNEKTINDRPAIPPPRYSQVIVNRVEIPLSAHFKHVEEIPSKALALEDLKADNVHYDVRNVTPANGNTSVTQPLGVHMSKWERYKTEKAARKAERRAQGKCCC